MLRSLSGNRFSSPGLTRSPSARSRRGSVVPAQAPRRPRYRFLLKIVKISCSPNIDFCNTLQCFSWFFIIEDHRFQDGSQVPFELQKPSKIDQKCSQEPPKTLPRRLQELPRSLQGSPRPLQETQKDSQEAAYSSQDAPKRLQEAPKRAQEAPKRRFWSLREVFWRLRERF